MNNILSALGYGGIVALIGILIVFLGLVILILCIMGISWLLRAMTNKKEVKAAPAPVAEAPVVQTPVVEDEVVDDTELIAVIAAAIAAFDNSGKNLVVRRVRRVSAWNKSSREEQVCRF